MTRGGRPLRFAALVLGGWTAMRVAWLWPAIDSMPALIRAVAAPRAEAGTLALPTPASGPVPAPARFTTVAASETRPVRRPVPTPLHVAPPPSRIDRQRLALALAGWVEFGDAQVDADAASFGLPAVPLLPLARPRSRFSGSAWLLVRGEGPAAAAIGAGQLGGAQAGVRLAYALDRRHRLAVTARLSSPLRTRAPEAALGVAWQPTRAAVQIVAEERVGLGGDARGGPTLAVVGGINPTPVGAGLLVEGYGQAGAIARNGGEAFADGAVRLAHPLASAGPVRLDLGLGAWGGAQRGAARLDLGPSLAMTAPLAGRAVRLSLDWRLRAAGDARPGSGVALTLGTDF